MVLNNKYLRHLTQLICFCGLKCYSNLGRVPMFVIHTKNQPLRTSPVNIKNHPKLPHFMVYIYIHIISISVDIIENEIIHILKQQSS